MTVYAWGTDIKTPKVSNAVRADIKLMWETKTLHEHHRNFPTARAMDAAYRVFTTVKFKGMTRDEVLQLLGDPRKSGVGTYATQFNTKDKLVYRFDTGFGGLQFDLAFDRHDHVIKLSSHAP